MLELESVESGYGETTILHGVNLTVRESSIHALLGRNGVGKSTTLKTIIGHLPLTAGNIRLKGKPIHGKPAYDVSRLGIAYVPETRDIFASLSVRENLLLAARLASPQTSWSIDRVVSFFPNLADRLNNSGHALSGGEQQMLALGRALMTGPDILLLDEPTEGLSPIIVEQLLKNLQQLKKEGLTILLIEQNLSFSLSLADDVSFMSRGRVVWRGDVQDIRKDKKAQKQWLGI